MLKLAESLRDSYEFIFIGPGEYSNKVNALGFEFKIAETYFFTPVQLRLKQLGMFNFLLEQYFNPQSEFVNEIQYATKKYDRLMDEIKPNLILVDDHLALKSLFYSRYKVPVIIVLTSLPAIKSSVVPPLQSIHIPRATLFSKWKIPYEWKRLQ